MSIESATPLYLRVAASLRSRFTQLPAATLVPAEPVLQAEYAVSRATLRRALEILEREGLVDRQPGRGTFISQRRLTHNLSGLSSWTDQLRATGAQAGTRGLHMALEPPPEAVVALGMPGAEPLLVLDRVRLADGLPISWMRNYLPQDLVSAMTVADVGQGSLYESLARLGVHLVEAEDVVTAELANTDASGRLEIPVGAPVLCTSRRSWLASGRLAEVGLVVSSADHYQYRVRLHSSRDRDTVANSAHGMTSS